MLWTVKYAPKQLNELVGNKANFSKLNKWLVTFSQQRKQRKSGSKSFKSLALLGGPPGIGKTSGVMAIAKELNYEIIEFNASDQRNAEVISRLVGRASKTPPNAGYDGKIVLLDEVDGITGQHDRGGLAALLKVAKEAFYPIITTANDLSNQKFKALKTNALFIKMLTPDQTTIMNLLQRIANAEGVGVDPVVYQAIAVNARGDLRAAINDLENLANGRTEIPRQAIRALSIRDTESVMETALNIIFGKAQTLKQAHEITSNLEVDYSMFFNYIAENITLHANNPTELVEMYANVALADLYKTRIVFTQNWSLLKYFYYFLSAGIRNAKKTPYQDQRIRFPSLLIDLSRSRKVRNLRDSVSLKIGSVEHTSKIKVNLDTLPFLRLEYEKLFELFQNDKIETPLGQKLIHRIAFLQYQTNFTKDELNFLLNDPLYEIPSKSIEKKQKELIKIIMTKSESIQAEQVILVSKTYWEKSTAINLQKKPLQSNDEKVIKSKPITSKSTKIKSTKIQSIKTSKKKPILKLDLENHLDVIDKTKKKKQKDSKNLLDFI